MARISEAERLAAMTAIEGEYWGRDILPGGMDEVGRGPLAGPVAAACVVLPPSPLIEYVNDSKKLSALRREKLYPLITDTATAFATAFIGPELIDSMNILNATKLAFKEAYEKLTAPPEVVLVDAVKGLDIGARQHPIVHGDALSYLIAAASVVAKVERDAYMVKMHERYPEYAFDKNKGYGTPEHIAALKKYGPCPIHRRSFIGNFI